MGLCCSKSGSIEIQDGADPVPPTEHKTVLLSSNDTSALQTTSPSMPVTSSVYPNSVVKSSSGALVTKPIIWAQQPPVSSPVPPKPLATIASTPPPVQSNHGDNGSSSALATEPVSVQRPPVSSPIPPKPETISKPAAHRNISNTSALQSPTPLTAIASTSSPIQPNPDINSSSSGVSQSNIGEQLSNPSPIQPKNVDSGSSGAPVTTKPIPKPTPRRNIQAVVHAERVGLGNPSLVGSLAQRKPPPVVKFNFLDWEHETIGAILKVSLTENEGIYRLSLNILNRVLTARLEHDPPVLDLHGIDDFYALNPFDFTETSFQYLVECWKRLNATRDGIATKGYSSSDKQTAHDTLERVRSVVMASIGNTLQQPARFSPQLGYRSFLRTGYTDFIALFVALFTVSDPYHANSKPPVLSSAQLEQFLKDIVQHFEPLNKLESVFIPLINGLAFHKSLYLPESICGRDTGWRGVLNGFEILASIKPIGQLITRMDKWLPKGGSVESFEKSSLLGPLCRLGVFPADWPGVTRGFFSELIRKGGDVVSSVGTLRGTFGLLHNSLASIFEKLARASLESREAVVDYFVHILFLSRKPSLSSDSTTAMSESFLFNIQMVLYRLASPFMDAKFAKIDRIDPLYFLHSSKINLDEEPRILASSEEGKEWVEANREDGSEPNFISNIFYLATAMSHYGYFKTVQKYSYIRNSVKDFLRRVDFAIGDGSSLGSPGEEQVRAAINRAKTELDQIRPLQLAFEVCLLDPEVLTRSISFTNFLITWLIRRVDPKGTHPNPPVELPLPKEVPKPFSMLPEYFVHDAAGYLSFIISITPERFGLAPKVDVLTFILTFLSSTWYIKSQDVKAKINEILFFGLYGCDGTGVLMPMLNTHPLALRHLVPAMIHLYIEVESPGTETRHTDKFNARQFVLSILKVAWESPIHRDALKREAKNVDRFVHFVNLLMNDLTFVMDESLSDLARIHNYEAEMEGIAQWQAKPQGDPILEETTLLSLERQTSTYTILTKLVIDILKLFTAETKEPFVMPEVVNRFTAMLNHNLEILVGPKSQELRVRNKEKYNFNPRGLLGDVIQVFMNLSSEPAFVRAIASDARSYSRAIFDKAANIVVKQGIKGTTEVQKFRDMIIKVEKAKESLKAEELEEGEIPDEFLDPLTSTLMEDPVKLPSSGVVVDRVTIKSHLLLKSNDPYNRTPLKIEDVIPQPELKAHIEKFVRERRQRRGKSDSDNLYAQ